MEDFRHVDGLYIQIEAQYTSLIDEVFKWKTLYPSKGITFVVHYPENLKMVSDDFGMERKKLTVKKEGFIFGKI